MSTRDETVQVRVSAADFERWRAAADADGRSLSEWVRRQCEKVAACVRPPREAYVRTSRPMTGCLLTVEPGVEFRDGDSFGTMSDQLYDVCLNSDDGEREQDTLQVAVAVEKAILARWPDRAYFVEVHGPNSGWLQIFQPFGVPRNR